MGPICPPNCLPSASAGEAIGWALLAALAVVTLGVAAWRAWRG